MDLTWYPALHMVSRDVNRCDDWPIPTRIRCVNSYRENSCLIRLESGLARVLISKPANFVTLVVEGIKKEKWRVRTCNQIARTKS